MVLQPIRARMLNQMVGFVLQGSASYDLVLDAPYQRPSVWGVEQQRRLVRSLLQGFPVPAIVVNRRPYPEKREFVVDGKQRIEAIRAFTAGAFAIPADWIEPERAITVHANGAGYGSTVKETLHYVLHEARGKRDLAWGDFTDLWQKEFERLPLAVLLAELPDEAAERDLYLALNFAGTPHSEADRARAEAVGSVTQ